MTECVTFFQPHHSYRVKIINPKKKNDIVVRELHNFRGRFHSVVDLCARLIEELMEQVPDSMTFSVRYFEGAHHRKAWIISQEDLHAMYNKYSTGPITLWCDGRV